MYVFPPTVLLSGTNIDSTSIPAMCSFSLPERSGGAPSIFVLGRRNVMFVSLGTVVGSGLGFGVVIAVLIGF